jgi:hypothetical protein
LLAERVQDRETVVIRQSTTELCLQGKEAR